MKGTDKKAWNGYKDALEAQKKLENFMTGITNGMKRPKNLKKGEVLDIPYRNKSKKEKKGKKD